MLVRRVSTENGTSPRMLQVARNRRDRPVVFWGRLADVRIALAKRLALFMRLKPAGETESDEPSVSVEILATVEAVCYLRRPREPPVGSIARPHHRAKEARLGALLQPT